MEDAARLRARMTRGLIITSIAAVGALADVGTAAASTATVGGSAQGVEAHANVLGLLPLNVGPMPSVTLPATGGGPYTASLLSTNPLGLVSVGTAQVSTQGTTSPGSVQSSAKLANVSVAGLVTASAAASSCSATTTGATGTANVVDLNVLGIPIVGVDLGPNTRISLPVGTVTINQQATDAANPDAITVDAVDVQLNVLGIATGNIVLGQSTCSVK